MTATRQGAEVVRTEGYLERGKLSLRTQRWQAAGGVSPGAPVVAVMHGYGEHVLRYDEVARYLVGRGNVVCGFDARGHGASPGQRGHVRAFADYVDDLEAYLEELARAFPGHPRILLGHSNGGLIATRFAQRSTAKLSGLILTCPLFGLQPRHVILPRRWAFFASWLLPRLPTPNGIKSWELSHDVAVQQDSDTDPLSHRRGTPRWYYEALVAMEQARMEAPRVTVPVLSVLGEEDPIVKPEAVAQVHELFGSQDRTLMRRQGARHEVLNEIDRSELHAQLARWIAERFAN